MVEFLKQSVDRALTEESGAPTGFLLVMNQPLNNYQTGKWTACYSPTKSLTHFLEANMKFRKKPVVIEARRLNVDSVREVAAWCGGVVDEGSWACAQSGSDKHPALFIRALEGHRNW